MYGITSCRLDDNSMCDKHDDGTVSMSSIGTAVVAIQWQTSDHFGSSRDGASGSVIVTVYVILARREQDPEEEDSGWWRLMDGASWSFFGLRVLPREA